jgi:nitrate/TMAO reductase-like tetraheme cytochrome c subunit
MGISMRRYLLTVVCFFSLVSVSPGAWSDFLQKEYPKTPWEQRPRVEQNVCLDCHTSDLMKSEYQAIPGEWRKSWHYQNGVSCQDCHGGDPKDAARSMTPESGFMGVPKPKEVPEFCGKCHIGIMENYLESGHGKALKATGRGPNCVLCHGSHNVQKATLNIINEKLCGVCHSYDRAKTIKASLLLTEQKINDIDHRLKTLKAGLIATENEDKVLFQTQAEYRTLFHTVDVNLVKDRTAEFTKKLAALNEQVQQGFRELRFRQNFSVFIMLIFMGLGITIFLLGRKSK